LCYYELFQKRLVSCVNTDWLNDTFSDKTARDIAEECVMTHENFHINNQDKWRPVLLFFLLLCHSSKCFAYIAIIHINKDFAMSYRYRNVIIGVAFIAVLIVFSSAFWQKQEKIEAVQGWDTNVTESTYVVWFDRITTEMKPSACRVTVVSHITTSKLYFWHKKFFLVNTRRVYVV